MVARYLVYKQKPSQAVNDNLGLEDTWWLWLRPRTGLLSRVDGSPSWPITSESPAIAKSNVHVCTFIKRMRRLRLFSSSSRRVEHHKRVRCARSGYVRKSSTLLYGRYR